MPLSLAIASEIMIWIEAGAGIAAGLIQPARRSFLEPAARETEVHEGAEAVAKAAPAWRSLEVADGAATAFQTLAVAEAAAAAHLQHKEIPRVAVVHADKRPVVVLPTVLSRFAGIRVLRFLGDPMIQYGDAVAAPEAAEAHLTAALSAVADGVADLMLLRKVRADAKIASVLQQISPAFAENMAPFVDLGQEPSRSARDVRELRRFRRRLAELGELCFDLVRGHSAIPLVRDALALKCEWLAARALPSAVIGDVAWQTALIALAGIDNGPLVASRLTVGGRLAAVEIGLVRGGHWCAFLGATAPEFAKAGPGQVQMDETIAACRKEGFSVYDMLAPPEPFKLGMASGSLPIHDHAIALTSVGRLGALAAQMALRIKPLFGRMPAGLRRAALSPIHPRN